MSDDDESVEGLSFRLSVKNTGLTALEAHDFAHVSVVSEVEEHPDAPTGRRFQVVCLLRTEPLEFAIPATFTIDSSDRDELISRLKTYAKAGR